MGAYVRTALLRGTMEQGACFPGGISEKRSVLLYRLVDVTHHSHAAHWPPVREHFLVASALVRNQPQATNLGSCKP